SALSRFTPDDFIRLVRRHHVAYHEKKLGQLFCDGSSQQIIDILLKECADAGVHIHVSCSVSDIQKDKAFTVSSNIGDFDCESLVVARGGLSVPKIGATDFGYRVARQFGIRVVDARPGLVPLTLAGDEGKSLQELSGVSLEAKVSLARITFLENILFTH